MFLIDTASLTFYCTSCYGRLRERMNTDDVVKVGHLLPQTTYTAYYVKVSTFGDGPRRLTGFRDFY